MRSLIEGHRRPRRKSARDRSRFRGNPTTGGRDLIRYRRNREALWREITTIVLWLGLVGMLLELAATLNRVAHHHLADRPQIVRLLLPAAAIGAAIACLWRIRAGWIEIRELRQEQAELLERMRRSVEDDPDTTLGP